MHPLRNLPQPSAATLASLGELAKQVKKAGGYAKRVARADRLWDARSSVKANRAAFDEVKCLLDAGCSGRRRCAYCEDSAADEIEHVWPKSLYPELTFAWSNYLYACGPCNVAKSSEFAVFVGVQTSPSSVARARGAPPKKPIAGAPVFIDPRTDDPLDYLIVDVGGPQSTGFLGPRPGISLRNAARATYTIDELGLNKRTYLPKARYDTYEVTLAALYRAAAALQVGSLEPAPLALAGAQRVITHTPHRFVWEFMKRERASLSSVDRLLKWVPQAIHW